MRTLAVLALAALLAGCGGSGSGQDGTTEPDSAVDAPASPLQVRPVLGTADDLDCDSSGDPELPGNAPAGDETSACDLTGAGLQLGPAAVDGGVSAVDLLRSTDEWILQITLDEEAASDLAGIAETVSSSDSQVAILLDGVVLSAPTVGGVLGDTLQVQGAWSGEQAERYAALLTP